MKLYIFYSNKNNKVDLNKKGPAVGEQVRYKNAYVENQCHQYSINKREFISGAKY